MMFQNVSSSSRKPSIPERWDSLFDNEAGSDVVFLVGSEPETWRFPGHSSILRGNPVFKAMLEGPFASADSKIIIPEVDGRAFDLLLRHLYHEEVNLQSVSTALTTLYAANKYLCPQLVDECVRYLDEHISIDTVLQIYQHLRFYSTDLSSVAESDPLGLPSAPPKSELEDTRPLPIEPDTSGKTMTESCTSLLYNCYQFIDQHADQVLKEENVEDLTQDALIDLAKRDTLMISSEMILFNVVEKWCNRECKRRQMELSEGNRKLNVGDRLLFSVRYLLMTSEEFLSGPMRSGLFDEIETTLLFSHILGHPVTEVSLRITPQVLSFLRRSRCPEKYLPIPLSVRTQLKVTNELKPLVSSKKKKKKKKEAGENKCIDYTLSVLACIFD